MEIFPGLIPLWLCSVLISHLHRLYIHKHFIWLSPVLWALHFIALCTFHSSMVYHSYKLGFIPGGTWSWPETISMSLLPPLCNTHSLACILLFYPCWSRVGYGLCGGFWMEPFPVLMSACIHAMSAEWEEQTMLQLWGIHTLQPLLASQASAH